MKVRGLLCCAVAALCAGSVASATTYYVDQNHPAASNSNPGTEALPWLTVGMAATSGSVVAGDTVIVKEGIYRERVTITRSGADGAWITYKANPGDRAILAGSARLSGWTQLTPALARGNPYYANIYYKDISFDPPRLDEDGRRMEFARSPDQGWWVVGTGSDPRHIVDPANLTQGDSGYWVGATVWFINLSPIVNQSVAITAYDPGTHTITVASDIGTSGGDTGPAAGTDLYYIYNKLELLDGPGQYVSEDLGGGTYRIYVWPFDSGSADNHMYEAPTETRHVLSWGTAHHVIIDGFEVRHSTGYGQGIGERISVGAHDIIVQNCIAYASTYKGICSNGCSNLTIRNCISTDNDYGITVAGGSNILIEECDVYANGVDGIVAAGNVSHVTISRCFVHDHFLWGHPDNLQTHSTVTDMTVQDSVILNSGQSHMIETTTGLHYLNTIVAGSAGYMLHGGATNQEVRGCTLAYSGYGLMTLGWTGYDFHDNIYYKGHGNVLYGADSADAYTSDYNLFYHGPSISSSVISWNGTYYSLASYSSASGQDTHSVNVDPLFVNAPVYYEQMDHYTVPYYTSTRLYLADNSLFQTGDHIEINFEGVVRTVTATGIDAHGDWIEYTPATDGPVLKDGVVANWKTNTDYALDLRVQAGSPALGAGQGGADLGADLSIPQFRTGDFDGDGFRDVPVWPIVELPEPQISSWKVVTDHGAGDEIETVVQDAFIDTRQTGVTMLRITFNRQMDPATVDTTSLAVAGQTSGDVSSLIQSVALTTQDYVLEIQLSSALPDADRYTLTLSDAVRAAGGDALTGSKIRTIAALAGDADGSGAVSAADMLVIRSQAGQAVNSGTCIYDVDQSGTITAADMAAIRSRLGNALP
ncbi:MAG: right-handed parallel beta-helix repeat-containing protein [Planctomycetes bacterium]|nr:right-handed parallel beta-helix repeat-containing protein [Planctomycetota bacterium]